MLRRPSTLLAGRIKRCSVLYSVGVVCAVLLLAPAVATASTVAASGHVTRGSAVYGHPWSGSYLKKVPSTLRVTHTRTIWLKFHAVFSPWADGAVGWDQASQGWTAYPWPHIKGSVAKVLKWQFTIGGTRDLDHETWNYITTGLDGQDGQERVKVQLTGGNGKKTIRMYFALNVGKWTMRYTPNFPISPTYTQTVILAH